MAEKRFGSRTFKVGDVLATDAIRLQARLLKIVGGGVDRLPAILAARAENTPEAKERANGAAVAALADMISKAEPEEVTRLVQDIAAMAQIRQQSGAWGQVDVDQDFSGHKGELFPFLLWVLKEVLGDFFGGLPGLGSLDKALAS